MRDGSRLYETEDLSEQFGTIRVEYDDKRLAVWVRGEIVFQGWRPPLVGDRVYVIGSTNGDATVLAVLDGKAWLKMDYGSDAVLTFNQIQIA